MFFFDCWREVNNKLTLFRMHQDMGLTKPCSLKFNWKWNKQEWCFGKIWTHFLSKEGGSFPRCEFSWAWKDQNSSPQSDQGIRLVVALASQLEDKNRIWNSAKENGNTEQHCRKISVFHVALSKQLQVDCPHAYTIEKLAVCKYILPFVSNWSSLTLR